MQSRRQTQKSKTLDYSNPKKSNQFSPSPIKRYQNQKSFTQSQINSIAQLQDDKENISTHNTKAQRYCTRRNKQPLQELPKVDLNIRLYREKLDAQTAELKSKSHRLPLQIKADNQQQQIQESVEFKNIIEQTPLSIKAKRSMKSERKSVMPESKPEPKEQVVPPSEVQEDNEAGVHEGDQFESSRSLEQGNTQQNKKQDNQSESLMDATYHSAVSGSNPGMQYQGRWTQEEHEKFLEGLKLFGKDWRQIEEHIGSRSCAQIRSHAQKYFNKLQRDQAKLQGTYQKSTLGKRKREESKRDLEPIQFQQKPQPPQVAIQQKTNQQVSQIHETLQKLAEDDMLINLRSLIAQREQICFDFLTKKVSSEEACKRLISVTNLFHQTAMKSLHSSKFEICNRMIDERNLTQFICILLSKQVTVLPDTSASNHEIIQHVHTMSVNSQDSLQTPLGQLGGADGDTHDKGSEKHSSTPLMMITPRSSIGLIQMNKQSSGNKEHEV